VISLIQTLTETGKIMTKVETLITSSVTPDSCLALGKPSRISLGLIHN